MITASISSVPSATGTRAVARATAGPRLALARAGPRTPARRPGLGPARSMAVRPLPSLRPRRVVAGGATRSLARSLSPAEARLRRCGGLVHTRFVVCGPGR